MKNQAIPREERGEITFASLKRAASEALYTFFTPARVFFFILAWPFRQIARSIRPSDPRPVREKTSLRSQG